MKNSLLLVIDIQERLTKTMDPRHVDRMCRQINLLASLCAEVKIPIFLSEQYPKGLGPTIPEIKNILQDKPHEFHSKMTFGCCEDAEFTKKLKALGRNHIILVGMETHICVYLTALGLIKQGYDVTVAGDAVISRQKFYYKNGLELCRQATVLVSNTETILFQLLGECGTPTFKKISHLLKKSLVS